MQLPSDFREALTAARTLAVRGQWEALRVRIAGEAEALAASTELVLLLAEAELRLGNPHSVRRLLRDLEPRLTLDANGAALRRSMNLLGAALFELGELEEAEALFGRALELANADGDALLVARATNGLGAIANIRGRHEQALVLYLLAIPACQRVGSAIGLAESFHNMAITFRDVQQLEEADEYELRAIEYAREAGSAKLLAMARVGRAELCLLRGDARLANAGASIAAAEYAAIPDPIGEADALRLVGASHAALGEWADALHALERAVTLARQHGSALVEAEALSARARLHASAGSPERARVDAADALAIYERLGAAAECEGVERMLGELDES